MCFDEAGEERVSGSIDGGSALNTEWRCRADRRDLAILHNNTGGLVNLLSVKDADVLENCSGHDENSEQNDQCDERRFFNYADGTARETLCPPGIPDFGHVISQWKLGVRSFQGA